MNYQSADIAALSRLVFTASSEGILVFEVARDEQGSVRDLLLADINPSGLALVQREREDLIGKWLSDAFPGTLETGIFDHYRTAVETGERQTFEVYYPHEGIDGWFKVSANPVSENLLIVTFVDVSALKRSTQLLEQREAELRTILNSMSSRIWFKDDKNTILRLNEAAADAMGVTVEEAEGANTYDLFPTIAGKYHQDDLKAFENGEPLLGIIERFVPKDGEQAWITTDKIPLVSEEDNERRLLVVSTDITRVKKAEEELRLANEGLSNFASIAAHDLQSPLRQIGLMADMLASRFAEDGASEQAIELAANILSSSARLRTLVTRLLEFSKLSTDMLDCKAVRLEHLIDAALDTSGVNASPQASVSLDLQGPSLVLGDQLLLTQVFSNLFQNSLKYGPQDRLQLTISSSLSNGLCSIKVHDNGDGINHDYAERIFEVFSRLHNDSIHEGTGIGLAFCRKVITRLGGEIWLDQNQDDGTCFAITLEPDRDSANAMGAPI